MSGKPVLKLTFGKKPEQPTKSPTPPPPSAQSSTAPKLKLKFGARPSQDQGSQPPAPPPPPPKASKKPKSQPTKETKPAARAGPSKKRSRDVVNDEADPNAKATGSAKNNSSTNPAVKRIKFSSKKPKPMPHIRLKSKGAPPVRPRGVGYDSEASDTEIDPALEENFVLRMQPGEDCDYLRGAVAEKRFGPRSQGGADVSFKSLTRDGRRAVVTVRGNMYAASLVDLPCIIESMKSWDKRGWYKSADICQMLLVLGRVSSEEEARNYPLPNDVDQTSFQYAHGLTPPLRWARKRRFRKRISNRTIEAVELEVARLIKEDEAALESPSFEIMDHSQYMREGSLIQNGEGAPYNTVEVEYDDEQDAEGEMDEYAPETYIQPQEQAAGEFEDDLAAEMEAALAAHADSGTVPEETQTSDAPQQTTEAEAEAQAQAEAGLFEDEEAETPNVKPEEGESSGDDESEESSPEDDANAGLDEDALDRQHQLQEQREQITELETQLQTETQRYETITNPILRSKVGKRVQGLRQELELKRVSVGEGGVDS